MNTRRLNLIKRAPNNKLLCVSFLCENEREIGRKVCKSCHKEQKRECETKRRKKNLPAGKCLECKKDILLYSKDQKLCKNCYILTLKGISPNPTKPPITG